MNSNNTLSIKNLSKGFTLTELLVVIAVIGSLASMLLTGMAKAKSETKSTACVNNLKQLQAAALMYSDDHGDVIPPNDLPNVAWQDGCPTGYPSTSGAWVLGDTTTDTTSRGIKNGVLYPYVKVVSA